MRQSLRRKFRIGLGILLAVILSCVIWGFFIEPNRFVVRYETIQIQTWPSEHGFEDPQLRENCLGPAELKMLSEATGGNAAAQQGNTSKDEQSKRRIL